MSPQGTPTAPPEDGFDRRISYLRLSVTDRCNLRCTYCMPAEGSTLLPAGKLLPRPQLILLAAAALDLGIAKIRVTGGEPLVRPDIVELLEDLGALPGLWRLGVTTNGLRLAPLAGDLRRAGVHGVNVSIDSIRPERFAAITRGGDLAACRAGIEAALAAGLRVKLNVVLMAGVNDDEIAAFARLAAAQPVEVRFIEYMPTGGAMADPRLTVPTDRVLAVLKEAGDLIPVTAERHAGPARSFQVPGWPGRLGVITPVSRHFCPDCNRIRVTAAGLARSCLFHDVGLDLRPLLEAGDRAGVAAALRRVVALKPAAHNLQAGGGSEDEGLGPVCMSRLGG